MGELHTTRGTMENQKSIREFRTREKASRKRRIIAAAAGREVKEGRRWVDSEGKTKIIIN